MTRENERGCRCRRLDYDDIARPGQWKGKVSRLTEQTEEEEE